jgi:hypothetical protein
MKSSECFNQCFRALRSEYKNVTSHWLFYIIKMTTVEYEYIHPALKYVIPAGAKRRAGIHNSLNFPDSLWSLSRA